MEDAPSAGTSTYCYHHLRVGHLLIKITQDTIVAVVSWSGNGKNIGMLGVPDIDDAKPLYIINRSEASQDFNITAIATATVKVK
jgi:hypothetical protein